MKTIHWALLAGLTALSVAVQVLGPHAAHPHWWDALPGSYALFGFLGCAAIVYVSKWIGKLFVLRREDYYDGR
jgi:hypothetical protein